MVMYVCLVVLFAMSAQDDNAHAPAYVSSWHALEEELEKTGFLEVQALADLRRHKVIVRLAKRPNRTFFREIAAQPNYPLVSLSGYILFDEFYPDESYLVAVQVLLNSDRPMGPIWGAIVPKLHTDPGEQVISRVMELLGVVSRKSAPSQTIIIQTIPLGFLHRWYRAGRHENTSVTVLANVIDRLLAEAKDIKQAELHKLQESLLAFSTLPGFPRQVYLFHGKESDPQYKEAMINFLIDPDTDEISMLGIIRKRAIFLRDNIALAKIALDDKRREFVRRQLEKSLENK